MGIVIQIVEAGRATKEPVERIFTASAKASTSSALCTSMRKTISLPYRLHDFSGTGRGPGLLRDCFSLSMPHIRSITESRNQVNGPREGASWVWVCDAKPTGSKGPNCGECGWVIPVPAGTAVTCPVKNTAHRMTKTWSGLYIL
ncbi:hypothetical protein TMatcc_005723 [Talaromyces marneffei ATCC 18224]